MSSNSVCNHTRDKQIGLPLARSSDFVITRMITDRIGLHSVLLPLLSTCACDLGTAETAIPMIIRGRDNSHHLLVKPKTPFTADSAFS